MIELSRGKFADREFGDPFCRTVAKEVEIDDLLLTGLLHYIKTCVPIKKTNTVRTLIKQVLTKYETELEEKNIKTTETFEENLPETMIPDEPLKYILNSVLLYAVASALSGGSIELLTKSLSVQKDANCGHAFSEKVGRYIEIRLVASGVARQRGGPGKTIEGILSPQKSGGFDLLLRLAKEVVQENRGRMRFKTDEEKAKIVISLVFPVERRKAFFNRPASISPPTNSSVDSIPDIHSL